MECSARGGKAAWGWNRTILVQVQDCATPPDFPIAMQIGALSQCPALVQEGGSTGVVTVNQAASVPVQIECNKDIHLSRFLVHVFLTSSCNIQ